MTRPSRRGFFPVLGREVRRIVSRPIYILLLFVLPLASFGVLVPLFESAMPRDLPMAVCDRDFTSLSRKLIRVIDSMPTLKVTHRVTNPEEGLRLIRTGQVYALAVIPADWQRDVYRGTAPKTAAYFNNQYLMAGSLINRDLTTAFASLSGGINVKLREKRGDSTPAAMAKVSPIRLDNHTLFNPYTNYAYYLLTALLPNMIQIFVIVTTVFAFGIELREGTARDWLDTAGGSIIKAFTGKILPYTATYTLLGFVANTLLFAYLGVPLRGDARILYLAYPVYVLAYQGVGMMFLVLLSNMRMAMSFSAMYSSPAFAFAGVTFPVVGMPALAKFWANILPLTHFIRLFVDQSIKATPVRMSLVSLGIIALFACLLPICLPRLKQIASHEKYWGRV